jgi:hypothetical protein
MAYHVLRERIVLTGGAATGTWEWDGASWVLAATAGGGFRSAMAYDLARDRVVACGGGPGSPSGRTSLYGNLSPVSTQPFGSPCAGSNGPPRISSNTPFLGNRAFTLEVASARPAAPCLFGLASGTQAQPLPGGCTLYLSGGIVFLLSASDGNGVADLTFAIPFDLSLRHGVAYAQGFVLDPMGGFAGVAFSAGLRLALGD